MAQTMEDKKEVMMMSYRTPGKDPDVLELERRLDRMEKIRTKGKSFFAELTAGKRAHIISCVVQGATMLAVVLIPTIYKERKRKQRKK